MQDIIKKIVWLVLYNIGFWKHRESNGLLVLTYHRISDELDIQDPLKVSMENFEKQILFLKENYSIISGEQLADIITNKRLFPPKACLITFDDGWRDNYTHAFPILKRYRVPAIIFISTDYIGTDKMFWHEKLKKILIKMPDSVDRQNLKKVLDQWPPDVAKSIFDILKSSLSRRYPIINDLIIFLKGFDPQKNDELNFKLETLFHNDDDNSPVMLSWEQVKEMSQSNICFGSHTKSHAILTQISKNKLPEELGGSKKGIEDRLGKPVYFLSYPNGNYNQVIIDAAKDVGYLASFTCLPGVSVSCEERFEMKRKHIREDHALGLNNEFSERFFRIELSGIRGYLKSWKKEKY